MGTKIVQHNIFGEMEEIRTKNTRKEVFEDYDGFVDKFKPKLTTDDCYTPQYVYDVIRDWVDENVIPLEGKRVVRPFCPGGDYRNFDYSGDCFVLDNPPFSILAEIRDFYAERNIGYFLFAPALTLFSRLGKNEDNVTFIVAAARIVYENGAEVRTSFITNRMPGELRVTVRGDLFRRVKEATDRMKGMTKKKQPRYVYPAHVISSALLNKIAERDIILDIPARECEYIRELDSQRAAKKSVFGKGFLLSERLAAERLAAERLAAERLAAERLAAERLAARNAPVWELSERENEIIKRLSANP